MEPRRNRPTDIERVAALMLGEMAAYGSCSVRVPDRHFRETLRAELRRLAREWDMRIRTCVYIEHDEQADAEPLIVTALRVTDIPWDDPNQRAISKRVLGLD